MNELKNDNNLREAVGRREQQLPPMPADLNERLMQRIGATEKAPKARRLWMYAAVAAAAGIALLIVLNFGKQTKPETEEPLVAQQTEQEVLEEPAPAGGTITNDGPEDQKKRRRDTKKVVMQLVELIPTSETATDSVKTLPESLIDQIIAYDQKSDPSRMTGIDDGTDAIVTTTMGIDDTDPLVAMAAQVEDIRQRGERLEREIDLKMDNGQWTIDN